MSSKYILLSVIGLALAAPASAAITCCEVNGKRTCGDPPPPQCLTKTKTVLDKGAAKEVEAPLTAEQRAAREAAEARKKEEDAKIAEQQRRDQALLSSYTNEKEIDAARGRMLAEIERNATQAQARLDAALKKRENLNGEKEFFQKKPMPATLEARIRDNESEIAAQQKILKQKDPDMAEINARYDTDKARYRALKSGVGR